jgi:hypothetical protein
VGHPGVDLQEAEPGQVPQALQNRLQGKPGGRRQVQGALSRPQGQKEGLVLPFQGGPIGPGGGAHQVKGAHLHPLVQEAKGLQEVGLEGGLEGGRGGPLPQKEAEPPLL